MNIRTEQSVGTRSRAALVGAAATLLLAAGASAASAQPTIPELPIAPIGPEVDPDKPNIVVIDAAGTITATARDRISYQHYDGSLEGGVETILGDLYPELAPIANLRLVQAASEGYSLGFSSAVSFETWYTVSRTIDDLLAQDDVDGVVVTAGTNVLEEDAYFFDLTVQSPKPVVVTGSMHQYGTFTFDGYTNLFSAIRLAASGQTTCYGTVVLLNDQFFAARDVTKMDGYRMDTFGSHAYGALGVVNEDVIRTLRAPARVAACGTEEWATPFDLAEVSFEDFAPVEIVYGYVQASPVLIEALVESGVEGIVTAGHGPGSLSLAQNEARSAAIEDGVLFMTTTRTGGEGSYDSGAEGNIGGGDLQPWKARILLMLGLTYSDDPEEIRTWVNTIGGPLFDYGAE